MRKKPKHVFGWKHATSIVDIHILQILSNILFISTVFCWPGFDQLLYVYVPCSQTPRLWSTRKEGTREGVSKQWYCRVQRRSVSAPDWCCLLHCGALYHERQIRIIENRLQFDHYWASYVVSLVIQSTLLNSKPFLLKYIATHPEALIFQI